MECIRCRKVFDNHIRIPRILNCGHTFCQICLLEILDKINLTIACPKCKVITIQDNVEKLIVNISLLQTEELGNNANNKNFIARNKIIGDKFNLDSNNKNLVLDEENSYGRFSLPLGYALNKNIVSHSYKNDFNNKKTIEASQNCSIHNKALEAYCETEKHLICISCILEKKHEGHIILGIEEAWKKEKEEMIYFESNIKNAEQSIKVNYNQIIKLEQDLLDFKDKNYSKIANFYSMIIEKIKEQEVRTKDSIGKKIEEGIDKINLIKEKIDNILTIDMYQIIEEMGELKSSNCSKTDFLQNYINISNKISLFINRLKVEDSNILNEKLACSELISSELNFKPSEEIVNLIKSISDYKENYSNDNLEMKILSSKNKFDIFEFDKVLDRNRIEATVKNDDKNDPFRRELTFKDSIPYKIELDVDKNSNKKPELIERIFEENDVINQLFNKDLSKSIDLVEFSKVKLGEDENLDEKEAHNVQNKILNDNQESNDFNQINRFLFKHKIPERKDSMKNSFNEIISNPSKNETSSGKEIENKDQNLQPISKQNYENNGKNNVKTHKRNNTTIGNFSIQNKLIINNDNKSNIIQNVDKRKKNEKDFKYNKLANRTIIGKNNNVNVSSNKNDASIGKYNHNSIKGTGNNSNSTNVRLDLSNISDAILTNEKLSSNLKNIDKSPKSSNKDGNKISNFINYKKNDTHLKNSDRRHSKKISCVFPSSTKNISKKELYTNKFSILTSLESKQDLMNDYPLINNVPSRVNYSDKKVGENTENDAKDILDSTVEFNSNNFNFINLESSINLDLLDNFDKESIISKNEKVMNYTENSKLTDELIEKKNTLNEFLVDKDTDLQQTRNFNDSSIDRFSLFNLKKYNVLIFGGKSKSSDFSTLKLNHDKEVWQKIEEIKIPRTDFGLLQLDNRSVLILGGKLYSLTQKENITDSIELIDIQKNKKIKLDLKLKQPKCNFGCLLFENDHIKSAQDNIRIIFVAGGYNGMDVLNHFEFYDFNLKKWFDLPNMPTKRKEFGLILDNNGILYFIGGVDEKDVTLKSVDAYNLKKNSWFKIDDMIQPRKAFGNVLLPDGIYVFGGLNGSEFLKTCEKYSFVNMKWEKINSMNKARSHSICLRSPDLMFVYLIGGYNKEILDSVERFNILESDFEKFTSIPKEKFRGNGVFMEDFN